MRITGVRAFRQEQPFVEGEYATSGGAAPGFDSLIVAVDTDAGITGWGEMAPLASFYSEAFAAGARAGVAELAPALVGHDPAQHRRIGRVMDAALRGHPYVKSALDMACRDAGARSAGVPLCEALGGRFGDTVALYRSLPPLPAEAAAAKAQEHLEAGYRQLQVKVGGEPAADAERLAAVREAAGSGVVLFADANGGWTTGEARRFLAATSGWDFTLEQPCPTLEECRALRPHCAMPMVLDESIDSLRTLLQAAGVADGVTIKISRVGGVSRAAALRDVAVDLGLQVTVEDTGGASIDTAAMVHLSLSTPEEARLHTVDFNAWVTVDNADGLPAPSAGELGLPAGPGLGVIVRQDDLGEAFFRTP